MFPGSVNPGSVRGQIGRQCPQSPCDFLSGIHSHLSIAQHVLHGDRTGGCLERCFQRQIAGRKNRQELIDVPLEPIGLAERMSPTAVLSCFKPRFILIGWPGLNPLQSADGLAFVRDQKILSQTQQSMHDLPWRVIFGGEQALSSGLAGFPDEFHERIGGILN